ncbi:deoxyribonuclease II family protein [Phenylobacterium sp.]|uniref:deoxyribonuclease II family protein n=1 Tax=Phenylobacterium sp. TaxID=1871053 RepID=UPI0025DD8EF4|nr:deoxyribonuclease II family protein [Phenylobacterium sp.]
MAKDQAVTWWFAFKFNAPTAPDMATTPRLCPFGGSPSPYGQFSQHFVYASNLSPTLQDGTGLIGTGANDPLGATFDQVFNGTYHYLVWNDQFKGAPAVAGCATDCSAPWGHSKGFLAWNDAGSGVVVQVTTPSWPGSGNAAHPRVGDGNTLGCVKDNDVEFSQHFFALALTHDDLLKVLKALANASVVTDPTNPQLANNGGPADVQALVTALGRKSASATATVDQLSSGVTLISKPSNLNVPPWQLVSAELAGLPLRAATWWATPEIYTTDAAKSFDGSQPSDCWSSLLPKPGNVAIAATGTWNNKPIGLMGQGGNYAIVDASLKASAVGYNHAKVGVSLDPAHPYAIFGDMNQQGALSGKCDSSQNGRGGLFYVVSDAKLSASVGELIAGKTAPDALPAR